MRPTPFEVELVDQSISRGPEVNQDKAVHTQLYIIIFFGGRPLITLLLTAVLHSVAAALAKCQMKLEPELTTTLAEPSCN